MAQPDEGFAAIVVGGSAGALEPLQRIAADLPSDFPAAIFVATHVPASSVSALPHLLARSGPLFATHAIDGAPVAPGRIIVAPPDHHLLVEDSVMRVFRGPMENNHRPSIDVLFRSAATTYMNSVCGVLLSGTLDDGVAGLLAIHEAGGKAIVQDPEDAQFPDMPRNAIRTGAVDGIYAADDIVAAMLQWLNEPKSQPQPPSIARDEREVGAPSVFTCPDCGGTLWEVDDEAVLRFRCRTGHAYSESSMLAVQSRSLETALWAAMRTLQERYDLLRRLAVRTRRAGDTRTGQRLEHQVEEVRQDLIRVNDAITGLITEAESLA
ncbi:MAG: chemotaxis protein CheB [Candidatus Eremiobacteraeota bacterium]|nr:chemotaxis protein CheB [Candidatus Eremiobacteraeota bacterium]MBV9699554.1 chemotaxis protein CheB [Candidatus Eremiobacteraeota bacterium]